MRMTLGNNKRDINGRKFVIPCYLATEYKKSFPFTAKSSEILVDASNCFHLDDELYHWYNENIGYSTDDELRFFKDSLIEHPDEELDISSLSSKLQGYQYVFNAWGISLFSSDSSVTYTGIDSIVEVIECIGHFALTNGYSPTVCEHCGKPFLRKHKNTKFCTRYSPLQGYTDKQCRDAVNSAMTALRERLNKLASLFRSPYFYNEKRIEEIKALRWRYLCPDCNSLEKLIEELSDTERFPPKGARKSDMIKYR